jgi:hypothetical protein
MEKPQAQNPGDDQKGGHDIAQEPRHDQNEDAGDKRDDGLQVTDTESHFTLPIAPDAGAAMGSTGCGPIAANTRQNKRKRRTTAVLTVSRLVNAARPRNVLGGEAAERWE